MKYFSQHQNVAHTWMYDNRGGGMCETLFSMLNDARIIYYIHGMCYGKLPLLLYFLYFVQIMSTRNNNRNASHSRAHANFQFV